MVAGSLTTFSSNSADITFQNGKILLGTGTDLTINTAGGKLTTASIRAGTGSERNLVLTSGSGDIITGSIGLAGDTEFASASLTGNNVTLGALVADAISLNPSSKLNVGENITSTNTPLLFPSAVVLNANSAISTGSGNISFSGTVDGSIPDAQNLTLTAGTGDITFSAPIGSTVRPNLLMISSAHDVNIGSVAVNGLVQSVGTGTTTISGAVTVVNNIGVQFTGTNLSVLNTAAIQTFVGSSITVHNSGLFTLAAGAIADGSFIQNGAGATDFSGSISTNLGSISFAGPVVVSGTPSMNSSGNNQPITFSNTLDGPGNLTLTAGLGNILLSENAGSSIPLGATTVTSAGNITIQDLACTSLNATASGTMQLIGNLSSSGPAGITLVGDNFI